MVGGSLGYHGGTRGCSIILGDIDILLLGCHDGQLLRNLGPSGSFESFPEGILFLRGRKKRLELGAPIFLFSKRGREGKKKKISICNLERKVLFMDQEELNF